MNESARARTHRSEVKADGSRRLRYDFHSSKSVSQWAKEYCLVCSLLSIPPSVTAGSDVWETSPVPPGHQSGPWKWSLEFGNKATAQLALA